MAQPCGLTASEDDEPTPRRRPTLVDPPHAHDCPACLGFAYEQREAGRFTVCRSCHGSGRDDVLGDRPPGLVVRDSRAVANAGLVSLPYVGRAHARSASTREGTMPNAAASEPVPVEVEVAPLPAHCSHVARLAHAIAARIERAATDLAEPPGSTGNGGSTLAHHDLWRFEAELARAGHELRGVAEACLAWRTLRDGEVAQAKAES